MKIIAFAASNSRNSINKKLATHAGNLACEMFDAELDVLDLNDFELPIFSADLEQQIGQPENAQNFVKKLSQADAIIVSFAEHNGNYAAVWKNLFDWSSRIEKNLFQSAALMLLSTSPGGRGGASVMQLALSSLPRFGTEIRSHLSVPSFFDNFDVEKNELINPELAEQLMQALKKLRH